MSGQSNIVSKEELEKIFERMAERWPSELVARTKVEDLTGGMLTGKTLANLDSLGQGPPRIKIGRCVAYPVKEFLQWAKQRVVYGRIVPANEQYLNERKVEPANS